MSSKSVMTMSEPFTVSGSGFRPGEPVVVQLAIGEFASPIAGGAKGSQVAANGAGAFSVSFDFVSEIASVIEQAPGNRTLLAQGADGSMASTPVEIVNSLGGTSPALATGGAEPAGDATIVGAGFGANEFVSIAAVGAGANGEDVILVGGQANGSGAFSLTTTLPTNLAEGIYTLRATGAGGSEATAALVVAEK